jgi:hypothetical protein
VRMYTEVAERDDASRQDRTVHLHDRLVCFSGRARSLLSTVSRRVDRQIEMSHAVSVVDSGLDRAGRLSRR